MKDKSLEWITHKHTNVMPIYWCKDLKGLQNKSFRWMDSQDSLKWIPAFPVPSFTKYNKWQNGLASNKNLPNLVLGGLDTDTWVNISEGKASPTAQSNWLDDWKQAYFPSKPWITSEWLNFQHSIIPHFAEQKINK